MNRFKLLQRFFSGVVAVTFFVTNTLVPVPIAHAANVESSAFIPSFTIPAEFGKVTDRIKGSEGGPLLIHIQEAHANYDAQKNIKNILEHLSENYGIRLILLEGAGNKLTPELFNFFPQEPELQQAVNEKLMQAGELTGAETFMISDGDERKAEAWGVENAEAYAKNREVFKRVFEGRELAQDFLDTFYRQWQKYASLLIGKTLKEFLTRETAFEEGRSSLADWIAFLKTVAARDLKLDLDDIREQKDWPVLVRYFRLKAIDPKIDAAKVDAEKKAFLKEIQKSVTHLSGTGDRKASTTSESLLEEVEQVFEQTKKHELPAYKTRFVFEKLLDQLPKDFSFDAFPNFRLYLQQIILLSELQSDALREEIKNLTVKITARLTQTEKDRQLTGVLHDFRLTQKLFQLELNRSEYQTILSDKITLEKLLRELQAQDPKTKGQNRNPSPKLLRLQSLYGTAIRFYEGAVEREDRMLEQAFARMQERKQTKAVLITGGFHTEGLKEKTLRAGSSYIEITPRIGEVTQEERRNYLRALLGSQTAGPRLKTTNHSLQTKATQTSVIANAAKQSHLGFPASSDGRFISALPNGRRFLALRLAHIHGIVLDAITSLHGRSLGHIAALDAGLRNFIAATVAASQASTRLQPAFVVSRSETRTTGRFTESFPVKLTGKRQIRLPAKFFQKLGKGAELVAVAEETPEGKQLRVYEAQAWEKKVIANRPQDADAARTYDDKISSQIIEWTPDDQGRVPLGRAFELKYLDPATRFIVAGARDSFLIIPSRSEVRGNSEGEFHARFKELVRSRNFPRKMIEKISTGTAPGFDSLEGWEAVTFRDDAAHFLSIARSVGKLTPEQVRTAEGLVAAFQTRVARSEKAIQARRGMAFFYFDKTDFQGLEAQKPMEFLEPKLKEKRISLAEIKGKTVSFRVALSLDSKYSGATLGIELPQKEEDIPKALDRGLEKAGVSSMLGLHSLWMESPVFYSKVSNKATHSTYRSEMRQPSEEAWEGIAGDDERASLRAAIDQDILEHGAMLYEVNARQLLQGRSFDDITDEELDEIRELGTNVLWFMGVWKTGRFSEQFNKAWEDPKQPGRIASAYSIDDYVLNPALGDEASFRRFVIRANRKGMKVCLDFVPNHMAADSVWVREHPEWFMQIPKEKAGSNNRPVVSDLGEYLPPAVTGPDGFGRAFFKKGLQRSLSFAVTAFNGIFRIAHGGMGMNTDSSWIDTAQLNLSHPGLQSKFREVLSYALDITNGGAVRIHMSHYTRREHVNGAWLAPLGLPPMTEEFWPETIRGLKARHSGALFFAETYPPDEGPMQQLGIDYTYDSYLYHALVDQKKPASEITDYLTRVPINYLRRTVHYEENHDDPAGKRIASLLKPEEQLATLAVLAAAAPGSLLLYQGQEKGNSGGKPSANWIRPHGVEETVDPKLQEGYAQLLEISRTALFRQGEVKRLPARNLSISSQIVAVQRKLKDEHALVLVNNSSEDGAGVRYEPDLRKWDILEGTESDYVWQDLVTGESVPVNGKLTLVMKPWEYRILALKKKSIPERAQASGAASKGNPLWEGIHERNSDWQRMNVILSVLLDLQKRTKAVVMNQQDVLTAVKQLIRNQGIPAEDSVILSLLGRLVKMELIQRKDAGFSLTVHPRVIAVKADDPFYIKEELEAALNSPRELEKILRDYSRVTALWPLYPIESRWPVLRAVALMNKKEQQALVAFLNENEEKFGTDELTDSILLMLKGKSLEGWLRKYAPHLIERTIYYDSPETILLAGGLGRVGQFHTNAVLRLVGKDAKVVLREPFYRFRITADNKTEEVIDYAKAPKPVRGLKLYREFNVLVRGNRVLAKIWIGTTDDGMQVYLIDGGEYYTRLLYRYDSPENKEKGWVSYSEFVEFFTRADVELTRILEEEKQAKEKENYKAPVLWINDGQTGPVAVYKVMLDRTTVTLRAAFVWMVTHTYRNRGYVEYEQMGFWASVWARLFQNDSFQKDPTSSGVRAADGASAVAAVHRHEVAELDPSSKVIAITNGDDRDLSNAVFRAIAHSLYPEDDVEFLTPGQIMEIKKVAKKQLSDENHWGLDPERIVISTSVRMVAEKAGDKRAFTKNNLRRLIKEGAQVIIYGNVQASAESAAIFEKLKTLAEEINRSGPGKLIVRTGWDIEDQRKLLAATDIQVQDSDRDRWRGTEAAGFTEANIAANAGLQMGPSWLEGIIQKQGIVLDREKPGSGNTLVPNSDNRTPDWQNDNPDAYFDAFKWAIDTFNSNRPHFASYQATSLRLSRVLEADLTAAEYLRQFEKGVREKDNLKRFAKQLVAQAGLPANIASLANVFENITKMDREKAFEEFGEEKIPAVMAAVAVIFPPLLKRIKNWDPEEYKVLSGMIQHPALKNLFKKGDVRFHAMTSRDDGLPAEDSIGISRTWGDKNILFAMDLTYNPHDYDGGKVWRLIKGMEPILKDGNSLYQVSDWSLKPGEKLTYPAERPGSQMLREWQLGIPVKGQERDDSGYPQRGKSYQALAIENVSRSEMRTEKAWPQHEAQKIAVIGTGFVGATKAILLVTDWGHDVIAVDIQPQIVEKLSKGKLIFHANDLQELLTEGLGTGKLKFTTDYKKAIEGREIIFLAVQTPQSETGHANINYLKDSVREIARLIHPGESKIIIGKSTAPPRDTVAALKAVVAGEFQKREVAGEDLQGAAIHFAWEPEFLREGKEVEDDRGVAGRVVIGADDPAVALKIKQLYAHANPDPKHARTEVPIVLTDLTSAPLVKYAANGYRSMKISFINFISWLTEELHLDIDRVAHDIATQKGSSEEDRRIGRAFLSAGLGFGGSCFPKDLAAAVQIARGLGVLPGLVLDALAVNELQWKRFLEKRILPQLQNVQGKTIVVLGASFKPGTDDIRESRAVKVIAKLLGRGAKIRVYDPVAVERLRDPKTGPFKDDTAIEYYSDPVQLNAMLENADAVILATEWPDFNGVNFNSLRHWFMDHKKKLPPIFDGRNFFNEKKMNDPEMIRRLESGLSEHEQADLKFPYFNIGHGQSEGAPLVAHEEFVERVREALLALRISYINMIAEIAERLGANIRDVKRGLGLDFVVGEEYLEPGIGWGGNKLSSALEALENYATQHLPLQLLRDFQDIRRAIQQKFEFSPEAIQNETIPVPFMTTVRQINDQQISLSIEKAKKAAGGDLHGKVVAVLGLAYKPGEYTTYKSRALSLIEALLKEGAIVRATDVDQQAVTNARRELVEEMHVLNIENLTLVLGAGTAQENARETVRGSELQFLVTASSAFTDVTPIFFDENGQPVAKTSKVVDGRHFYDPADLKKRGIEYFAVGVPSPSEKTARSEIRRADWFSQERTVSAATALTPSETVADMDRLITENTRLGGGQLQGFRRVTEKITDGIWSLTAHALNAVELVFSFFFPIARASEMKTNSSALAEPETLFGKTRLIAARSALKIKTIAAGDAFIIRPGLAFKDGALIVKKMVFGEAPVTIYDPQGTVTEKESRLLQEINMQLAQAHLPPIRIVKDLDGARSFLKADLEATAKLHGVRTAPPMHLKFMANVLDPLAVELKRIAREYKDDAILVTSKRFQIFLELAGVAALVEKMQNEYLATARSA